MPMLRRLPPVLLAGLLLAGCGTFLGAPKAPPLEGKRVSVLNLDRSLKADPELSELQVKLPQPYENPEWPQPGGYPSHAMHHLALPDQLRPVWTAEVGEASSSTRRLLAEPVVAGGRVYTMDAASAVTAFDLRDGHRIWRVELTPEAEADDELFGGGLAVADGRVYVTTPFAKVFALDAASGAEIWHASAPGPMRAAPSASDGRVFVVTIDNQLLALAADDGRRLWSHAGIIEAAGLLGGAAPAVAGNTVIAPYSSGEIYALRVETGRILWNDNLAGAARGDAIATLADIRGRPIIDRDLVLAVSHSGLTAAIDLRRGGRNWDKDIGGTESPWVAGDFYFVLDNNAELVCLTRADGRIRWVQALPLFEDQENREGPIYWAGPVLAGDRLVVTGSNGLAVSISPYTGKFIGRFELPGPTHLPPVVAGNTLYFLSDDANLTALR